MRMYRIAAVAVVTVSCVLAGRFLLLSHNVSGQQVKGLIAFGPLPPPPLPPDVVPLTTREKLGKLLLYDSTLSDPPGYSCATCHVPETGSTGPSSLVTSSAARCLGSVSAGPGIASPSRTLCRVQPRRPLLRQHGGGVCRRRFLGWSAPRPLGAGEGSLPRSERDGQHPGTSPGRHYRRHLRFLFPAPRLEGHKQ